MVVRGGGKIEIKDGSDDSDAGSSGSDEQANEERNGIVFEAPLKTVTFPNVKKQEQKRLRKKRVTKKEAALKLKKKHEHIKMGMVKPDIVRDKVKERTLRRIATSGVAQLFNAVTERQKKLDEEIERQKGHLKNKEKLSTGLNFGPPKEVVRPKKEEVEDWLNDTVVKDEDVGMEE